jgi:two-component system, OmpR family, sensor histidine kinase SenX3
VNYSDHGTNVHIVARVVEDVVEVSVKDEGIGIERSELDRVFERFYRVDPARSRETGGTGLGLAIVKHVMNNHGGEVTVWSTPGVGSTFTLRVPAAVDAAP